MKTNIIAIAALAASITLAAAAEKIKAPNGGRIIDSVEPHAEFLITADKKIEIRFLDDAGKVVLAPRYFEIWRRWYFASQVGTFVFQWRPISPLKDEAAVIVHDVPEAVPGLREDYPDREIVRLSITEAGAFTIQPVAPSLASEAGRQLRNGPQQ